MFGKSIHWAKRSLDEVRCVLESDTVPPASKREVLVQLRCVGISRLYGRVVDSRMYWASKLVVLFAGERLSWSRIEEQCNSDEVVTSRVDALERKGLVGEHSMLVTLYRLVT